MDSIGEMSAFHAVRTVRYRPIADIMAPRKTVAHWKADLFRRGGNWEGLLSRLTGSVRQQS